MNIRTLYLIFAVALPLAGLAIAASLGEPCCAVVSVDALRGTVNVRNNFTGRLMQINSAELAKTLKPGDALDADADMKNLTSIKGVARTLPLIEPDAIQPCCNVVAVLKDRATVEALLGGIFANVQANPAEPVGKPRIDLAEPIADFRSKIKGVDAIKGVQADFSSELNGAEPISGIVVARNITTGALHVLNLSVLDANTMSSTSAPITSSVKIGDPVSIDPATGIAVLKGGSGTYAFNLLGVKKTAEPAGAKGPWVVEPDPKAKGQFGIVRTIWHEKAKSGHRSLYVYLPGERGKHEYYELHKVEHSVMVGEYDMKVNGVILEKVPVKAGHATRILMGALHYTAKFENQLAIYDAKGRLSLKMQGGETFGLPIGTYHLKVGTRMVPIEIKENEVTDF